MVLTQNVGFVKNSKELDHLVCVCACVCVCVCMCVCVCLWANHLDVVRLGVKVDQGLPCVRHYIPRSSGKPL